MITKQEIKKCLLKLDMQQKELLNVLKAKKINISQSDLSIYISKVNSPMAERVIKEIENYFIFKGVYKKQ